MSNTFEPPELPDYMRVRPLGVALLGGLHLLGGLFMLVPLGMLVFKSAAAEHSLRQAGIPISLLLAGMIILGLLYFLSGLGMLAGKKWGWWLAVFYYVYSVARHANALFVLEDMAEQLGAPEGGLVRFQIKYGVRIVFALLVLVYLFREPVRIYFRLEQTSKLRAIGTVVGVCLALWSAISGALILMAD